MIEIIRVTGLPEVHRSDDIAALIASSCTLQDSDVVVVTQKIVSKSEGRVIAIDVSEAEQERNRLIEQESVRLVAQRADVMIVETRHGLVCANAGIDASNIEHGYLCLLPLDPDASAEEIRKGLLEKTGRSVAVIVSDTFGRPWRSGQTNIAIGVSGMSPIHSYIGEPDTFGNPMHATEIAIADEIAGAAELVMGKVDRVPVAIVRGFSISGEGSARMLVRDPASDLFRTGVIEP
ncbi:MAG: coenzyme F420-0:L-glutamate ligase [Actinomycetota bacterium]